MSRVKDWFAEVCAVVDSTPQLQYAIAAALVIPVLIFDFGAWLVSELDTTGPFGPIVAAIEEPLAILFAALSAMTFIRMFAAVAQQYRKVRARLYGYRHS